MSFLLRLCVGEWIFLDFLYRFPAYMESVFSSSLSSGAQGFPLWMQVGLKPQLGDQSLSMAAHALTPVISVLPPSLAPGNSLFFWLRA